MAEVNNSHQGFVVGDGKHPGTCKDCGASFEGIRPGMTQCFSCNYNELMSEAEARFAPLKAAVEAAGWRAEVWQTGGMVMCLAGFPTDAALPYCMWSDPDEYPNSIDFCVYLQDEDSMQDAIVEVPTKDSTPERLTAILRDRWADILAGAQRGVEKMAVI